MWLRSAASDPRWWFT